jgi:hypothetical protein
VSEAASGPRAVAEGIVESGCLRNASVCHAAASVGSARGSWQAVGVISPVEYTLVPLHHAYGLLYPVVDLYLDKLTGFHASCATSVQGCDLTTALNTRRLIQRLESCQHVLCTVWQCTTHDAMTDGHDQPISAAHSWHALCGTACSLEAHHSCVASVRSCVRLELSCCKARAHAQHAALCAKTPCDGLLCSRATRETS